MINASPNIDGSHSRALCKHFVDKLETRYPGQYVPIHRDLENEPIPYVHSESLEVITSGTATTVEAKKLKLLSDTLIDELKYSDAVVIATPMHNFTIPAVLKAYFDLVLLAGKTFQYTSAGPVGMLTDRPVMLISASGGCYAGTEGDFLVPYIKYTLRFIGINKVTSVVAEGLAMGEKKAMSLTKASQLLEKNLEFFS
ncbi:MAG TPA: NAD(P)H-dependent oxidoreductase [Alphaproteobacteria bacterium]|nr:NAD(P)H-dependent oxidoreductase [Alphaproteobacteria bacterium]HQS93722.1 NAD(P)H-dependent oxidoreductase [Alphaproteobacteria bacterium]